MEKGRPTGLEPATASTTNWSSTIELRSPLKPRSAKRMNPRERGLFRRARVKLKFYGAGFKPKSQQDRCGLADWLEKGLGYAMKIVDSMAAMRRQSASWARSGEVVGLVPTMES